MDKTLNTNLLERYKYLIDISRDLASTLNLDTLLFRIVRAAAIVTTAEEASILLYDNNKKELRFQAATNLDNPTIRGMRVPVNRSIAGWIFTNGEPLIVDDVESDSRHFGHMNKVSDIKTKSILGVPLVNKNEIFGVLEAINKQSGKFTFEDQEVLMILSAQAAVAIQNARFFAQSDLISDLVHEIQTPLASLNTAAHLIADDNISSEKKKSLVDAIQTETKRLSDLATSFLDFSRLDSNSIQFHHKKIDLIRLLEECANLMQSQAQELGINLMVSIPSCLPPLEGDPEKIKQAVINLLSNAVKYNVPNGEIILAAKSRDNDVMITVADSGIGIPEEQIEHLFSKFYRVPGSENHARGTGLGLSIVKRIIDGHGGEIFVESSQGEGSTFKICLPIYQIQNFNSNL